MWPSLSPRTRAELPRRSIGVIVEIPETTIWTKPDEVSLDDVLATAAEVRQLLIGYHDGHTGELPKDREVVKKLFTIDN